MRTNKRVDEDVIFFVFKSVDESYGLKKKRNCYEFVVGAYVPAFGVYIVSTNLRWFLLLSFNLIAFRPVMEIEEVSNS